MASGGSDRQTGTVPKTKARNNCNVPQEVVTPTRRDIHSTNIMTTSVDWLPVSEHNTRPSQNKSRKPTNIPPDNEFAELDSSTAHEGGSRFVPVRPQPRTLVLRQRDNLMDNAEDNASYNSILGGHSPHTSHTAIMIVNPTTPNSNQTNQNMNSSGSSSARNNMRGSSVGRDPSYANVTAPVCPHPVTINNPKPTNVSHDSHDYAYQNGTSQNYNNENVGQNQQAEHMLPRTEVARFTGDSMVAACTDTVRVEQRLGQIREYIRVTSTLVDSMRNSEDELRTRLTSLRRSNDLLMASVYQEPDEGPDSDVVELMETLDQLKDSEKKLEDILRTVDETKSNRLNEPQSLEPETTESSQNHLTLNEESILKECTQGRSDRGVIITEVTKEAGNNDLTNLSNQEGLPRPASAQSSVSAYSDSDLWQNELKANMEISQLRLAAALQEQKRLLKYQADAKEQLAEIHMARNGHMDNMAPSDQHEQGQSNYHSQPNQQPLASQAAGRVYGTNQIGVATTLPHVTEGNQHNNIHNWNNQGARKRSSNSREREMNERTLSTVREPSEGRSKGVAVAVVSSDQAEIDMLRDLQMRRQHLESQTSQVAKIQNLHAATSSLADAVSCPPTIDAIGGSGGPHEGSRGGPAGWDGSEASEEEGGTIENTIRNKVAAVNVMKVELERLKNMLRTVDSIQNNFGINASFDDESVYDNTNSQIQQENHNRNHNRGSESSVNNIPLCRTDSSSSSKLMKESQPGSQNSGANSKNQNIPLGLSRLQNCISSGSNKCTNVSEPNQSTGDSVGSGLAAIQQLTHELKQAAQGLSEERRRLKHANRDICTSSGSSIKSEDKKRTNSISGGNTSTNTVMSYPPYSGPMERRQIALKAELEAKKKQLERLMSKDVDHRTNQQSLALEQSGPSKPTPPGTDDVPLVLPNAGPAGAAAAEDDCACSTAAMRTDIDNGYSSDQDDDEAYLSSSRNQLNINQMGGGPSHKLPSRGSSIDNFKDTSYFDDSTQSLDGSFASQSMKHNKHQQSRTNMAAASSSSKQHNREPASSRTLLDLSQELQELTQRAAKEFHNAREAAVEGRGVEAHSQEREMAAPPISDCFLTLPVSNNVNSLGRSKDCDVSNVSNASSGSSSEGERDPIPPPMASLPPRHHRQLSKNNHENSIPEMLPPQWHNPHSESQVTMWWHNKANQLQQQLEMTSNLCQSLLQDKRTGQMTPSTFNSSSQTTQVPNSILLPNYQNNCVTLPNQVNNPAYPNYAANPMMFQNYPNNPMYLPNPAMGMPGMMLPNYGGADIMAPNLAAGQLWALQQQQAAAQQQQVAAAAWGSAHCIQHLLSQQREISSLRTTVSNLEEKLQTLNLNMPRAHSTPPHINFSENAPNVQGVRANSAQSNSQSHYWNIQSQANQSNSDTSNANPSINPSFIPSSELTNVHPSNLNQPRASKVTPNIPPFPAEHFNNQLPANFSLPSNIYQSEQPGDQMTLSMATHSNVALTNQPMFNNCTPPAQLNPNMLSNQSIPQPIQNNRNPNCLLNLTPHVAMNNPHPMGTQTLSGQSTALNNQVPPGNRANNYWDNFRSYSRQNLLSGSSKTNADPAFPTHSPHPLVERSHNTLHSSTPPTVLASVQTTNTPKRNVNYPTGNAYSSVAQHNPQCDLSYDSTQRRGRRNLSQETEYFTAPPDVLNVNQNLDTEPNQLSSNVEELSTVNRFHTSLNVNVNRLSTNPIPEIIQAHSNNLNVPRSNGAHKKKSSSKLPAKNASNSGNYSLDYVHSRNVEANASSEVFNPNLATASSSNSQEKSTTKLFDLLRENVYSEVTALISANESRPHFLIQLFRDLQQISSDTLRQRALQSIQELVAHYLSAVETESYEANEDHRNMFRNPTANDNQGAAAISQPNETAILALDIDNEIVRFILAHHSDICSDELLESLRHIVMSTIGDHNEHSHLDNNLSDCFAKYQGCKLMDISDDLVITISRIISTVDTKHYQIPSAATESTGDVASGESSTRSAALLSYQDNVINDRHFAQLLLENSEMEGANMHMEGLACAASMINNQNEVMGLYASPGSSTHDPADRFVGMPDSKIDLIESVETYNGDLAEADQSRHGSETTAVSGDGVLEGLLPDVVDTEEQTPTEAEAEWLGLDRVPTRLQIEDNPGNQSDSSQA